MTAVEHQKAGTAALHVTQVGTGRPLLYLHGIDGTRSSGELVKLLASMLRSLCPIIPGSDARKPPPGWNRYTTSLISICSIWMSLESRKSMSCRIPWGRGLLSRWRCASCARFRTLTLISAAGIHVKGVKRGDLFMRAPDVVLRSMVASPDLAEALVKSVAAEFGH